MKLNLTRIKCIECKVMHSLVLKLKKIIQLYNNTCKHQLAFVIKTMKSVKKSPLMTYSQLTISPDKGIFCTKTYARERKCL